MRDRHKAYHIVVRWLVRNVGDAPDAVIPLAMAWRTSCVKGFNLSNGVLLSRFGLRRERVVLISISVC
eukprot:11742076-Prorocentrum_lima.AAC.1